MLTFETVALESQFYPVVGGFIVVGDILVIFDDKIVELVVVE